MRLASRFSVPACVYLDNPHENVNIFFYGVATATPVCLLSPNILMVFLERKNKQIPSQHL